MIQLEFSESNLSDLTPAPAGLGIIILGLHVGSCALAGARPASHRRRGRSRGAEPRCHESTASTVRFTSTQ